MCTVIVFLFFIGYAIGHVTVEPQNAAVVAGEMMSMECRTDEESRIRKWEHLTTDRTSINVYLHGNPSPYHPEFTHFDARVNSHGSGILYTNSTRKDDAGLYICVVRVGSEGKRIQVSAQLIVFESQPICETNLSANKQNSLVVGDYIWMRCSVVFRGFWMPTMEWSQEGGIGNMRRVIHNVGVVRLPNKSVTSTLIVVVDSSMKDVFFSCKTYFTEYDGETVNMTASNVPNFSYIWNSEAVDLPNYPVPGTVTVADSSQFFLVGCLSLLLVLVIISATVVCILKKRRVRDQSLGLVDNAGRTIQLNPSPRLLQPPTEPNSQMASLVDTENHQMAETNKDYCQLADRPAAAQEPKVYCQLRFQDPPIAVYANLPTEGQKCTNEHSEYFNVTEM